MRLRLNVLLVLSTRTPQRRLSQPENADRLTTLTQRGMLIERRLVQLENAYGPMVSMLLSGIVTLSKFLHPMNALEETLRTFCEKLKYLIGDAGGKQMSVLRPLLKRAPLSTSKKLLLLLQKISRSDVQPSKTRVPMRSRTLHSLIVNVVRDEQLLNA